MNTSYFLNNVMENVFKAKGQWGPLPNTYYIALLNGDPTSSGVEPSGKGYGRVALSNLAVSGVGTVTNLDAIALPESTGTWGTMTHYAVYDARVGGNLLFYGPLTVSRNVESATIVIISAGELSIKLSNP